MKAQIKVNANLIVEAEAESQKDLFKAISSAHEIFGEKECGLCQSKDIYPAWRISTRVTGKKTEEFNYPEWRCRACRAKLSLGTINDETGTLFPVRKLLPNGQPAGKDEKDKAVYGGHNGWHKYVGEPKE